MDRLQEILVRFAAEIRRAVLEEAFESLRSGGLVGPAVRRGPGRPKGEGAPRRREKSLKRNSRELEALVSKLHASIKSKPGQRIEEIATALGTTTKELALPTRKLIADKKVKKTGTRRATKYFPA